MGVYKEKLESDGSLDKLKFRIVVREDLQNKELVVDTWSTIASMRTLKYFFENEAGQKICRLLSRILKLLWKSLDIIEVHVWYDQLWEVTF